MRKYLFLFLILIAGCGDEVINPTNNNILIPLKVGNSWTYRVNARDTNGYLPSRDYSEQITSDTVLNGANWYLMQNSFGPEFSAYYQNRANGVWFTDFDTTALYFAYPAEVNTKYDVPYNSTITLISTSASVAVPTGTYSCYQYRWQGKNSLVSSRYVDWYIAPGVGIVKIYLPLDTLSDDLNRNMPESTHELQSLILK